MSLLPSHLPTQNLLDKFYFLGSKDEQAKAQTILQNLLKTDLGESLVTEIFSKTAEKTGIYVQENGLPCYSNEKNIIYLNNRPIYIIKKAKEDKVITDKVLSKETLLFHELIHKLQFLILNEKSLLNLSITTSDYYDNLLEEDTILWGRLTSFSERAFCIKYSLPFRCNRSGSYYPGADKMIDKDIDERSEVFINYLFLGAQKDLDQMVSTFSNVELQNLFNQFLEIAANKDKIKTLNFSLDFFSTLKHLLDTNPTIVVDKTKLNLALLNLSIFITEVDQLKDLEKLGFDFQFEDDKKENILFRIPPFFSSYVDMIKYLKNEHKLDLNKINKDGDRFYPLFRFVDISILLASE